MGFLSLLFRILDGFCAMALGDAGEKLIGAGQSTLAAIAAMCAYYFVTSYQKYGDKSGLSDEYVAVIQRALEGEDIGLWFKEHTPENNTPEETEDDEFFTDLLSLLDAGDFQN